MRGAPHPLAPAGPRSASHRGGGKSESARLEFMARALAALEDLASRLDVRTIGLLAEPVSGYGVLLSALEQPVAVEALRREDPLAGARLRGLRVREEMLEAEGGVFTGSEMAQLLRISRQAVDKRRRAGRLLAVELGRRRWLYPAWQVVDGHALAGIEETLAALREWPAWTKMAFFLSGDSRLGGDSPLAALRRGRVEEAVRAARAFGEHGAA